MIILPLLLLGALAARAVHLPGDSGLPPLQEVGAPPATLRLPQCASIPEDKLSIHVDEEKDVVFSGESVGSPTASPGKMSTASTRAPETPAFGAPDVDVVSTVEASSEEPDDASTVDTPAHDSEHAASELSSSVDSETLDWMVRLFTMPVEVATLNIGPNHFPEMEIAQDQRGNRWFAWDQSADPGKPERVGEGSILDSCFPVGGDLDWRIRFAPEDERQDCGCGRRCVSFADCSSHLLQIVIIFCTFYRLFTSRTLLITLKLNRHSFIRRRTSPFILYIFPFPPAHDGKTGPPTPCCRCGDRNSGKVCQWFGNPAR